MLKITTGTPSVLTTELIQKNKPSKQAVAQIRQPKKYAITPALAHNLINQPSHNQDSRCMVRWLSRKILLAGLKKRARYVTVVYPFTTNATRHD
ncbi:hypothetical protein DSUL_140080 [Desulfovibrionales bacterium]